MGHRWGKIVVAVTAVVLSVIAGVAPSRARRDDVPTTPVSVLSSAPTATPDPAIAAAPTPSITATPGPPTDAELRRLAANELGRVPIVSWHDVADQDTRWDTSITTFRKQLLDLYRNGYRPVSIGEFIDGTFDVAPGTTPVVLTFDDSFRSHLFFDDDGEPHADSVVGTLEAFARRHRDWRATAVFYLFWPRPFREAGQVDRKVRWLLGHGYELGNHGLHHDDLSAMNDDEVERSLATLQAEIAEIEPGFRFRSLALPFGMWPSNRRLAVEGAWDRERYRHDVVLLVGDMPAFPPYHADHDQMQVPRVQSHEIGTWLAWLERDRRRFISDGDPVVVTYPASVGDSIRPAPRVVRAY